MSDDVNGARNSEPKSDKLAAIEALIESDCSFSIDWRRVGNVETLEINVGGQNGDFV